MRSHRLAVPIAAAAALAAVAWDAALYALSVASLAVDGPNVGGYGWLLVANRVAVVAAVLVVLLGVLATLRGLRRTTGLLVAAAAVALTTSAGLRALGVGLAGFHPLQQPVDLNSLLLAVGGTGQDLLPVPVVLAIGAGVTFAVSRHARRSAPAIVAG